MTTRLTMFQLGVGNSTQVNGIEAFDVINTRPLTEVPLIEIRRARIALWTRIKKVTKKTEKKRLLLDR
jgi:hypothetical protein